MEFHQPGEPSGGRVDRAADEDAVSAVRRIRPQSDREILQQQCWSAATQRDYPTGRIVHPRLGRSREDDVARLAVLRLVAKDVLNPGQPRQMANLVRRLATRRDSVLPRLFQPSERNVPQFRFRPQLTGSSSFRRREPCLNEPLIRLAIQLRSQQAIGIDANAERWQLHRRRHIAGRIVIATLPIAVLSVAAHCHAGDGQRQSH